MTGGTLPDAQSLADQTGIGTPAIQLIAHPTDGEDHHAGRHHEQLGRLLRESPRLTMSTLAPAGGVRPAEEQDRSCQRRVESVATRNPGEGHALLADNWVIEQAEGSPVPSPLLGE